MLKVILSVDVVRFPLTGIGRYAWELAQRLPQQEALDDVLFMRGQQLLSQVESVPSNVPTHGIKARTMSWLKETWIMAELHRHLAPQWQARALKAYANYIYHGPNFYLPPFDGLRVATFHDLSPFTWAHSLTPQRARYIQKRCLYTVKHADALITDSEFVKQELVDYFSYPADKIFVTPLAASEAFYPRSSDDISATLAHYALSYQGYSLFVGSVEPRKNLDRLLQAYEHLPHELRQRYPLVIVGHVGWNSQHTHDRMRLAEQQGWLRYLGYTPENCLPELMAGARLFIFPSLYEGFGLPPLEAMASAVPVVAAQRGSLPEVLGDVPRWCHPEDIDDMSQQIAFALSDVEWRDQAVIAGLNRAAMFNWERCAQATVAAYQTLSRA